MKIQKSYTNADRQAAFRARHGDAYRKTDREGKRKRRAAHVPTFVGIDCEGIGKAGNHRAVLLGCGENQYLARDMRAGLHWKEVFEFLYNENFLKNPEDTVYVGFYLGYDFNQWLRTLLEKHARSLLTKEGKAARLLTEKEKKFYRRQYKTVKMDGWEIDMLAFKALSFRPRVCDCYENRRKCTHDRLPFMTICDAGSFFQSSFMDVLKLWKDIRTQEEYDKVEHGKLTLRANQTRITKKHKEYNALENVLLARVMHTQADALNKLGLRIKRDRWYGPGAVAQEWLRKNNGVRNKTLLEIPDMPEWLDVCRASYYGGWFEIFSHGYIPGKSYNYDINSAYPYAITKLPHLCNQGKVRTGEGRNPRSGGYVLLHCTVYAKGSRIGPVPHRNSNGSICRPNISKGWYWAHELDAANAAGLVSKVDYHEWVEYIPCNHPNPYRSIADLYNRRRDIGSKTPQGIAIKLVINSVYGKFAQSVGGAPYNNWFYASYITSHCRTQILNAIATHPDKSKAVLMVATDGVCFDSPHPWLPGDESKKLGEWEPSVYDELCLFKPGVYWHKSGKEDLLEIKSRGVPQRSFAEGIDIMERIFREWSKRGQAPYGNSESMEMWVAGEFIGFRDDDYAPIEPVAKYLSADGWPRFPVRLNFHMTSCLQALQRNKWELAGETKDDDFLMQSSDPHEKRTGWVYNRSKKRIDSKLKIIPASERESLPYKDPRVKYPKPRILGFGINDLPFNEVVEAAVVARGKESQYDLDLDIDWTTVWDGGPV